MARVPLPIRVVAFLMVCVVALGGIAFKQQDVPITYSCGRASGGSQLTAGISTWLTKVGAAGRAWLDSPDLTPAESRAAVERVVHGVVHDVLAVWWHSFADPFRGVKLDPNIVKLQKAAEARSAAAHDQCTPCPSPRAGSSDQGDQAASTVTATALSTDYTWSAETVAIARAAIAERIRQHLPAQADVVIFTAGLQESGPGLRNLAYGDSTSVGWLQLIDTNGTVAQRMNPTYSARWFFGHLRTTTGWQQLPVDVAAQRVQRSGHPNLYADNIPEARALAASLRSTTPAPADPAPSSPQCVDTEATPGTDGIVATAGAWKVTDRESGVQWSIPKPADPRRQKAIAFVIAQVDEGDWYQWAAQGPDRWDCSGLVAAGWRRGGVTLTPQTEAMRAEIPATTDAQPGDLLYRPGHVQMYLGEIDGQTIIAEAPRTGSRLRIRPQWMNVAAVLDPLARPA